MNSKALSSLSAPEPRIPLALAGGAGNGKDTVTDILVTLSSYKACNDVFHLKTRAALADPIKQYLAILFGWKNKYAMDHRSKKTSTQALCATSASIANANKYLANLCKLVEVAFDEAVMGADVYLENQLRVAATAMEDGSGNIYLFSETPRKLYTSFGTDFVRETLSNEDFWVDVFIKEYVDTGIFPIVTDVRRTNEATRLIDAGYLLGQVVNPRVPESSAEVHVTEQGLPHYLFHFSVVNDGTVADLSDEVLIRLARLSTAVNGGDLPRI